MTGTERPASRNDAMLTDVGQDAQDRTDKTMADNNETETVVGAGETSAPVVADESAGEKKSRVGARARAFVQVMDLLKIHHTDWSKEDGSPVPAYIEALSAQLTTVYESDAMPGAVSGKPGRKPMLNNDGSRVNPPRSLHYVGVRNDGSRVYLHTADPQQFADMFASFAGPYKTKEGASWVQVNGIRESDPTFASLSAAERMKA